MNRLSSKHLAFFIIVTAGIAIRTYSSIYISIGGRDTWIGATIAGIIILLYTFLITYICNKTETTDIRDVFKGAFPKWLGNTFIFLFALSLFVTSVESAATQTDSIHTTIFLETPVWYSLLFFIIPAMYLITRRLETLLIVVIVSVSIVFASNLVLEFFAYSYQDFSNMLPILGYGITKDLIYSTMLMLGSLSSIAICFPFLRFLIKKEKLPKYSLIAVLIVVLAAIGSINATITTFGPVRASNIFYPEFIRAQRMQFKGFMEFGEILFLSRTVIMWFIKYVLCAVSILYLYKDKIKSKKVFAFIYSLIAFISSYLICKNHYDLFTFIKFYNIYALIFMFFLPLIAYLIYYIKWKKKLYPTIKEKDVIK